MSVEKDDGTVAGNANSSNARKYASIKLIISVGLTICIGYVIYRQVPDWRQSLSVMIHGKISMMLAGLFFISLHIYFRATRWGMLLKTAKPKISFRNLFSLTLIKYVINVIPPRAGEVASSILLARKENIATATVIAASVFERILDMISVLTLFAAYIVIWGGKFVPNSETGKDIILRVRSYSIKGFAAILIVFAILFIVLKFTRLTDHIPPKMRKHTFHFLDGFRALQSHGDMFKVVLLSLAIWISITIQLWCLVHAYLDTFPWAGAVLIMALTVIGVSIPTPGGIGGFQYFMNLTLIHFFGQYLSITDPNSQAAGISNGCYLMSMGPIYIAGLYFMNREGISFRRTSHLAESAQISNSDK